MAQIKEFLQRDYPTVTPKDSLESVIARFLEGDGRETACLVVLDADGIPIGLVDAWLVLSGLAVGAEREEEPAVDALMKKRVKLPVASVMAEEFPVFDPEDDLFSALAVLGAKYFEVLPVMKGNEYLGAVRTIDLFQAIAEKILGGADAAFGQG